MCYYITERERIYHIAKVGSLLKRYIRIFTSFYDDHFFILLLLNYYQILNFFENIYSSFYLELNQLRQRGRLSDQWADTSYRVYLILCSSPYRKKKPYNNINIWKYRRKGGDISASTWRQACSYAVARRAGEAEKAEYDPESCFHIASRSRNRPIPKYCVIVWGPKAEGSVASEGRG